MKLKPILSKKGQISALTPAVIAIGIAVIILAMVFVILENLETSLTAGGAARNATTEGIAGLAKFSDFWVVIVIAVIAMVVIGLILGIFAGKKR